MRRLLLGLLLLSGPAFADPDYSLIDPPEQRGDRVEVTEFFYYGCEQCRAYEPFFASWLATHPEIGVRRIPAYRPDWLPLARTYYVLDSLGIEAEFRNRIYDAMRRIDLADEATLFSWIERQGIDRERFIRLYRSEAVSRKIAASLAAMREFGISGTPSVVIDGSYLVLGNLARPELLDRLVEMAKRRRNPE